MIGLSGLLAAPQLQLTREAITCRGQTGVNERWRGRDLLAQDEALGWRGRGRRGRREREEEGVFFSSMVTDRLHGICVSGNSGRRERRGGGRMVWRRETGCVVTEEPRRHCWPPGDSTVRWKHKQTAAASLHFFFLSHTPPSLSQKRRPSHLRFVQTNTFCVCVCLQTEGYHSPWPQTIL